jgi:hypothetical protein
MCDSSCTVCVRVCMYVCARVHVGGAGTQESTCMSKLYVQIQASISREGNGDGVLSSCCLKPLLQFLSGPPMII